MFCALYKFKIEKFTKRQLLFHDEPLFYYYFFLISADTYVVISIRGQRRNTT